jgi:DNA-directed RNA polymerase specialized sigma24 family protein
MDTTSYQGGDSISQEQFERLLYWLDAEREKAGIRYEFIRKRLIKIFVCRGSTVAEELADLTINRVAQKLPEIQATYTGEPARYFCGVAANIFRESLRKAKTSAVTPPVVARSEEDRERDHACLEECIEKLPQFERDLVISYYEQEKHEKIDNRRKLAERLGLGLNALRIRACHIRSRLRECVEKCRSEQEMSKQNAAPGHT